MSSHYEACPACGGKVHVVAGTCRHCGADLVALRNERARAARRAAAQAQAAPLPPVQPPPRGRAVLVVGTLVLLIGVGVGLAVGLHVRKAQRTAPEATLTASDSGPAPAAPAPTPAPFFAPPPPAPAPPAPRAGPPDAGAFVHELSGLLCDKLTDCGLFTARDRDLCQMVATTLPGIGLALDPQPAACRYDQDAASSCLDALDRMACTPRTQDPQALLALGGALDSCTRAVRCP